MLNNLNAAADRLSMGMRRLLDHHPLLGGLLSRWRIIPGPVKTMGVKWEEQRITLVYEPTFVLSITMSQLENVLMHEVRHVIYGHCFMDPEHWTDSNALTIAQEVSVNEGLIDLPVQPIILADYPMLLPDTNTQERYFVLADMAVQDVSYSGSSEQKADANATGSAVDSTGDSTANALSDTGSESRAPSDSDHGQLTLDDHRGWGEFRENRTQIEVGLRHDLREISEQHNDMELDAQDADKMRDQFLARGSLAGSATSLIGSSARPITVNQLRNYLGQLPGSQRDRGARFDRPPRRAPALIGIMPARVLVASRAHTLAVIDTSGSMDEHTLASIAAILRRIEDVTDLTIVQCDAAIHAVYPYAGALTVVAGRGGTDLRPPFGRAFLAKTRAEALIYFTDGCGVAPKYPPQIPVIWALTHGGASPTTWGKVLHVES